MEPVWVTTRHLAICPRPAVFSMLMVSCNLIATAKSISKLTAATVLLASILRGIFNDCVSIVPNQMPFSPKWPSEFIDFIKIKEVHAMSEPINNQHNIDEGANQQCQIIAQTL